MSAAVDPIGRRREALLIAARLQRRNVAARWDQLQGQRVVGWIESVYSLTGAMRGTRSLRGAASGSLTAMASSALWAVRERSWWGIAAFAGKWLWRRRERRQQRALRRIAQAEAARTKRRKSFFSRSR